MQYELRCLPGFCFCLAPMGENHGYWSGGEACSQLLRKPYRPAPSVSLHYQEVNRRTLPQVRRAVKPIECNQMVTIGRARLLDDTATS
jgi:hypothetical protein